MPMPVPGMYAFDDPFGTGGVVCPSRGRLVKFLPCSRSQARQSVFFFEKGHECHIIFCGRGSGQFQWPRSSHADPETFGHGLLAPLKVQLHCFHHHFLRGLPG